MKLINLIYITFLVLVLIAIIPTGIADDTTNQDDASVFGNGVQSQNRSCLPPKEWIQTRTKTGEIKKNARKSSEIH